MAQIRFGRNCASRGRWLQSPAWLISGGLSVRWFQFQVVSSGKEYSHQFREFREQHEIRFARIDLRRRPGRCRWPGSLEQECFSEDIRTPTN